MKKVININFQGRVIPIEEPAYEILKKYIESLRQYFAQEEGKEEIINDIENRIAELFSEKLKSGQTTFVSEEHVAAIMASMGTPEQFDEAERETGSSFNPSTPPPFNQSHTEPRGSLYRNRGDKMLGGVCSGIGAYLRIDTTIVRVLFAMLALGAFGTGFVLYVVLWAVLPAKFMSSTTVARKLYRDAEQKAVAGVCSGIAKYFNIAVWIPRLIFAIPVLLGIFKLPFSILFFPFVASFSGTMFLIYIILWAVVPKAVTASEKLEMRGEKVDLESIKNKVQDELQEVKKNFSDNSLLRILSGIIKVFFFLILGLIALGLILVVFGMLWGGAALMPLKDFVANSEQIQWYAWGTILLLFTVPVLGLVITLVKKIAGIRSRTHYLTYTLVFLWIMGWLSVMLLASSVVKEYKRQGSVRIVRSIQQPSEGRMKVEFVAAPGKYYPIDFNLGLDDGEREKDPDAPQLSITEDSLLIAPIKLKIRKSIDDSFHVALIKRARGSSTAKAEEFAEKISYQITQSDSLLYLPTSFPITTTEKFRNQQLIVEIAVPVGKEIYVSGGPEHVDWIDINDDSKGISIQIDQGDDEPSWRNGVWYIMTESGIEKKFKNPSDEQQDRESRDEESEDAEAAVSSTPTPKKLFFTAISLLKMSHYIRPKPNP